MYGVKWAMEKTIDPDGTCMSPHESDESDFFQLNQAREGCLGSEDC